MKMPKLGTKNGVFRYFWQEFQKTIVLFEISTLKFVISESLTHTVSFGIESAFSTIPSSAFSEDLCPGPGLLNKVCLL